VFAGAVQLVVTPEIVAEYLRAAEGPNVSRLFVQKSVRAQDYAALVQRLRRVATLVEPVGEPPPCRDEDDRKFLHAAVTADVDYLITYDKDLLDIKQIGKCAILTPSDALDRLRADGVAL
jgi:putative PIN family toxin of toxin-antitoxin system